MADDDDEDDYLSMSFAEAPASSVKETSLQRTARLKREAAERARPLSKADRAAKAEAVRDAALATKLDSTTNKGALLMAKMGFKGGALGAEGNQGRENPIEVMLKDGRGGIGVESEKKRKLREMGEAHEAQQKKVKMTQEDYRHRNRQEREDKRAEGQWWSAMRILEGLDEDQAAAKTDHTNEATPAITTKTDLATINLLYRPLVKNRREKEQSRKDKKSIYNGLSASQNYLEEVQEDDKLAYIDDEHEDLEEDDPACREYEELPPAERLDKIVSYLRHDRWYCFWCKYQYSDETLDGCPGATEDEHG